MGSVPRFMGLDIGSKRIGVAISDAMGWTAQPLAVIERTTFDLDFQKIEKWIHEYQVDKIIVGQPLSLSFKITEQTKKILDWVERFKQKTNLPIEMWEEALTSKEAEKILIEANVSRKKRKKVIDKLAAQRILQSYMDSKK